MAGAGAALGSVTAATIGRRRLDRAVRPAWGLDAAGRTGSRRGACTAPTRPLSSARQLATPRWCPLTSCAADRAGVRDLLRVITDRARLLYAGGLPVNLGPAAPTDDNGILGPAHPGRPGGVRRRPGGIALRRPLRAGAPASRLHLSHHGPFPNDNLDPAQLHGDLSIQVCAADQDTVAHALRDITKHTRGAMQPRWKVDGFVSPPRPAGTPA